MGRPKKVITKTETVETDFPETPDEAAAPVPETPSIETKNRTERKFENPLEFPYYFEQYLKHVGSSVEDSTLSVYKKTNTGIAGRFAGLTKYNGTIPNYEEIALAFGPGSYKLILFFLLPNGERETTSIEFMIESSKHLNDLRAAAGNASTVPQGNNNQSNDSANMFNMFEKFMQILSPIITRNAIAAQTPAPVKDDLGMVRETAKLMSDMMKENMRGQVEMIRDFSKQAARLPFNTESEKTETDTEEKEEGGIMQTIEKLLPMVQKFLPMILGKGPESDTIINLVKGAPDFKNLISDKSKLVSFVREMEKKIGPDDTSAALKKFGITL